MIAVDVGYGQLDWRLRNDDRVTVMERTNVRDLSGDDIPFAAEGIVADLSFISLRLVIRSLARLVTEDGDLLLMVKPQFEVGKERIGKGGVVSDPKLWRSAVDGVVETAASEGFELVGAAPSRLPGPAGNREFFVHLRRGAPGDHSAVDRAIAEVTG